MTSQRGHSIHCSHCRKYCISSVVDLWVFGNKIDLFLQHRHFFEDKCDFDRTGMFLAGQLIDHSMNNFE